MAQDDERDYESSKEHAAVLDAETLPVCCTDREWKDWDKKGVLVKVPVVIAEPKIQVNVESTIRLENKALEIKRIYKNLFLTQCELIPDECGKYGKLFLSGFIRKNIEYATAQYVGDCAISGDIRHTTAKVPFTCVAVAYFLSKPELKENFVPVEVEVLNKHDMGKDPNEKRFNQHVSFNEGFFCELVEAKFREIDIKDDPKYVGLNETVFDTLTEKIVVDIKLKVLQNQQIELPKFKKYDDGKKEDKKDDKKDNDKKDHDKKDYWKEHDEKDEEKDEEKEDDWDDDWCGKDYDYKKTKSCCKPHKNFGKKKMAKNGKSGTWEY